jgi:P27 family predicted phage terminase small subunit
MAKGRPVDPTRAKRGTGHRAKPGETKASAEIVVLPTNAAPVLPKAPKGIPEDAVPIWDAAVAELMPRGIREADLEAVRMLVMAAYRHRQASEYVERYGLMIEGPLNSVIPNPMLKLEKDSAATYLRLAEAFGLSLAARLRLGLMQLAGESILTSLNKDLDGLV